VTVGAGSWWHRVRSGQRETGAVVVEGCVHPVRGVVTTIASLRKICRNVIRIGRPLIVLEVATHTGRAVQAVVVVNMTICASSWWYRVQARKRKTCAVVVESCIHPVRVVVTLVAGLREVRCHVIRISCALIVLQVTGHASRACQVVVIVHVTIRAGARWHRVQTGQRESGGVVIKRGIQPGAGAVALLAGLREIRRHVIRIGRALEIL